MKQIRHVFSNSWLFPRYIGTVHMTPAMQHAAVFAQGTLVDIGCGKRQYEPIFAPAVTHYIGVDWPVTLEQATPDVVGDALFLPVSDGAADTVLSTELMEHLPDPHHFLAEVARILRPGGIFILSVPFLEPLHEEPRDYWRFTPYSLRTLLGQHGFGVRELRRRGGWGSVAVGSFVSQMLYDIANPTDAEGLRQNPPLQTALILPLCALAQYTGYLLDRVVPNSKYTLGYVIVAVRDTI
jgi:SAM-dependent methyltransferase